MVEVLNTQQLRDRLILSRSKIDEWVEYEKANIDALSEKQRLSQNQNQKSIDVAATDLIALQLEGGLSTKDVDEENGNEENIAQKARNDKERDGILQQQELIKQDIDELQKKLSEKQSLVQDRNSELHKQRNAAQAKYEEKKSVIKMKDEEIKKLQCAVSYYKTIGLDFVKDDADFTLRFAFTQLDPNDPTRKFTFCLKTDDDADEYVMPDLIIDDEDKDDNNENNSNVDHDDDDNGDDSSNDSTVAATSIIPREVLQDMLDRLNRTEDMSYFVSRIRKAFIDNL